MYQQNQVYFKLAVWLIITQSTILFHIRYVLITYNNLIEHNITILLKYIDF